VGQQTRHRSKRTVDFDLQGLVERLQRDLALPMGWSGGGHGQPAHLSAVLVTNHHVLPTRDAARSALVEFNVEVTWDRLDRTPVAVDLAPDAGVDTVPYHDGDWTLVKVKGDANQRWGPSQ
jgi:hypothetical protein